MISPMRSKVFLLSFTLPHLSLVLDSSSKKRSRLVDPPLVIWVQSYATGFQITSEAALNVVRQAVAAGVKHVSYIGTIGTLLNFAEPVIKAPLTGKHWNNLTEEVAFGSGSDLLIYTVAKTRAEQALFKFAEEHPELNLTSGTFGVFV